MKLGLRSSFANELPSITQPFSIQIIKDEFCPLLFRLLHDPEAETKTSSCKAMSGMLKLLKNEGEFVFEKFMQEIESLTYDGSPQVRREIALHLMELAPIIGKEHTIKSIIPIFLQVLRGTDN
jgi:serine/threonine-protein phosphatase 2A regulatory subunit A